VGAPGSGGRVAPWGGGAAAGVRAGYGDDARPGRGGRGQPGPRRGGRRGGFELGGGSALRVRYARITLETSGLIAYVNTFHADYDGDALDLVRRCWDIDALAAMYHELIAELRRSGVTIFLTTHRLEEAERLCDRVAILNTTLRTIGRPAELRDRLFAKTLTVRTLVPLPEPGRVFAGLPAVDGRR